MIFSLHLLCNQQLDLLAVIPDKILFDFIFQDWAFKSGFDEFFNFKCFSSVRMFETYGGNDLFEY